VDPVQDEMLANFVVDSHFKSHPKHNENDDDPEQKEELSDPEVIMILNSLLHFCLFSKGHSWSTV
jgi:hypothetical protein